jgi:hypothetical protein
MEYWAPHTARNTHMHHEKPYGFIMTAAHRMVTSSGAGLFLLRP